MPKKKLVPATVPAGTTGTLRAVEEPHVPRPIDMINEAAGRLEAAVLLLNGLDDLTAYDLDREGGWVRQSIRDIIECVQTDLRKSYEQAVGELEAGGAR